jgi:integrase
MAKRTRTQYPGVYSTEHATRKNGVGPDRYFEITYRLDGKKKWEGLGWASKGMKASLATELLAELKSNQRTGHGPRSLREKRAIAQAEEERKGEAQRLDEQKGLSFKRFVERFYWPAQEHKSEQSKRTEAGLLRKWIYPAIGDRPLLEIVPFDIERIKSAMLKAKRSPATIRYAFAVVSQVWSLARRDEYVATDCPTKRIKIPKIDNRRDRFLTPNEAQVLLQELIKHSQQTHDMTLVSLYSGLRFGEVAGLTWRDVDIERGVMTIRDPKARINRQSFINEPIREVMERLAETANSEFVFVNRNGAVVDRVSNVFRKTADKLFNQGVTDKRQKVVFHTLRHTFASWLVENGTSLYAVKELLGHSDFKMTQRYSHLAPDGLRDAANSIEKLILRRKGDLGAL